MASTAGLVMDCIVVLFCTYYVFRYLFLETEISLINATREFHVSCQCRQPKSIPGMVMIYRM